MHTFFGYYPLLLFVNNFRLVHGLLSCKNCANVWNRDCNGA